jgi:DNA-binding LytR/AlgR family response regulator
MIRCFIIDDEPHAIAKMEQFVRQTPFLQWVGSYTNALEAVHQIQEQQVDLLFLDIHMPEISGMDVLKMVNKDVMIILTTGYSEYAVEGFEYNAIDYLLKPITYVRFLKAAQKAYDRHESANQLVASPQQERDYIFIKGEHKGKQIKIDYKDIEYIEGLKNYVAFHCGNEKHMVVMTMKDVEALLPYQSFARVHNSFIISLRKIKAIEGNQVILTNQKGNYTIPIGPTYKSQFLERIGS